MALSQNTYVYMETVETPKDKEAKSDEDGDSGELCTYGGKQPKRLLVLLKSDDSKANHDKRKTDKQWLL